MRAEWNHLVAIKRQRRRDVGYALFRRGFAQLVSLGQRDDSWHLCLRQEVQHGAIIFARVAPDVQQQDYTPQLSGPPQITFDERLPLRFTLLRDPRVTIAWQIDQHEAVVDAEKIYLARPARSAAHPRERLSPYQSVEQRRLADVGPPRECNLRQIRVGTPAMLLRHPANEFDIPDYQLLDRRGGVLRHLSALLNRKALRRRRSLPPAGDAARSRAPRPSSSPGENAPTRGLRPGALRCPAHCHAER